jgi:hypothetical protein
MIFQIRRRISSAGWHFGQADPFVPRERVPQAYSGITRAGDKLGAVGAERDGVHIVGVAAQLGDLLVRYQVPQADRIVLAADRKARPVGAEDHRVNRASDVERGELAKGSGLRHFHCVIRCDPCNQPAVAAVGDSGYYPRGAWQLASTLAGRQVP